LERNEIKTIENHNNFKKTDDEQELLDSALYYYELSQEFWTQNEQSEAIDALDQAYGLILKVDPGENPELIQQKEDLRIMISKRILEIHASLYTAVHGSHNAIPLTINNHVKNEIKNFLGPERKFFIESFKRSGRYRGEIVKALKEAGLPEELSWLPLIESGFKINALSSARALGMWQFIPSTGYKFGLNRDTWIDERMDPEKSTAAAISYLQELHKIFGDWTTVLAAYNCGEGMVLRKIRTQKINYLDNFWDLYEKLPRETARYVPRFLATLLIIKDPKKYEITLGKLDEPLPYEEITIDKQVNLKSITNNLGEVAKDLLTLNPELRYSITPPNSYTLKVPQGKSQIFLAKIANAPEWCPPPKRTYVYHKVKRGETLSLIALKYNTTVRDIIRTNNIRKKHSIQCGQRLKIHVADKKYSKSLVKNPATIYKEIYTIKRGDSLSLIAKNFNTTVKELCRINNLSTTRLYVGQKLKITNRKARTKCEKGKIYYVKRGDTPYKIANEHDMSLSKLLHINDLDMRCKIYPGQKLVVSY
jgi:membrane-bound lytic murein transglycosylase D